MREIKYYFISGYAIARRTARNFEATREKNETEEEEETTIMNNNNIG